jgi:hypothetical protein
MKPFPEMILSPTTAHRIPLSVEQQMRWIEELLTDHDINATAFVMPDDLLPAAKEKGFRNDLNRALADLKAQLKERSPAAYSALFPSSQPVTMVTHIPSSSSYASDKDSDGSADSLREDISIEHSRRRDHDGPRLRM